jgi:hypothetical protein
MCSTFKFLAAAAVFARATARGVPRLPYQKVEVFNSIQTPSSL